MFGKITDFETEPCDYGDAFVVAPDNSRAGLVWEVSNEPYFQEVCPLEPDRWGVWGAVFPSCYGEQRQCPEEISRSILPELKKRWEE